MRRVGLREAAAAPATSATLMPAGRAPSRGRSRWRPPRRRAPYRRGDAADRRSQELRRQHRAPRLDHRRRQRLGREQLERVGAGTRARRRPRSGVATPGTQSGPRRLAARMIAGSPCGMTISRPPASATCRDLRRRRSTVPAPISARSPKRRASARRCWRAAPASSAAPRARGSRRRAAPRRSRPPRPAAPRAGWRSAAGAPASLSSVIGRSPAARAISSWPRALASGRPGAAAEARGIESRCDSARRAPSRRSP